MEQQIYGVVMVVFGLFFAARNVSFLRAANDDALVAFLERSPPGRLWIGLLGLERTVGLTKRVFLPLGVLTSLVLVAVGAAVLVSSLLT